MYLMIRLFGDSLVCLNIMTLKVKLKSQISFFLFYLKLNSLLQLQQMNKINSLELRLNQ